MGKKTAKTETAAETTVSSVEKPKTDKPKTKLVIVPGRPLAAEDKLATQARIIVEVVHEVGTKSREELLEVLKDRVKTRQPIERILGYYQKTLETKGFIKIEKVPEPVAEAA